MPVFGKKAAKTAKAMGPAAPKAKAAKKKAVKKPSPALGAVIQKAINARELEDKAFNASALRALLGPLSQEGCLDGLLGSSSNTPLTLACVWQDAELIQEILSLGADPLAPTRYGQSPMMQVLHNRALGNAQSQMRCMEILLDAGADIHHKNQVGQQAIHWAFWEAQPALGLWLISKGADVNALDSDGCHALHHAAHHGNMACAKALVESGADLFLKAKAPGMPAPSDPLSVALEWSKYHGKLEIVSLLAGAQLAALEKRELEKSVPEPKRKKKPGPAGL